MNTVIEELLLIISEDPVPAGDASSYWQLHGNETTVERDGDELVLSSSGFGAIREGGRVRGTLRALERFSYRGVTNRLDSYPLVWRAARRLAYDLSVDLPFNTWKQAAALTVLMDHLTAFDLSPKTFALIGDGHGFLGALIHRHFPESRIYHIDLPKTLVFQAHTHELADPGASMSLISKESQPTTITFVLPKDVDLISDQVDCAVNIASMQEMTEHSIASYFRFLRQRSTPYSRFYCVNRLRKELPGGEVASFNDYPWQKDDEVFIDGPCPYYTHVLSRRTDAKGPRVLGVRLPFINYFDGPIVHRLARLAPN